MVFILLNEVYCYGVWLGFLIIICIIGVVVIE